MYNINNVLGGRNMVVGVNISSFRFKKKNAQKEEFIPFYSDFSNNKKECIYSCKNIIEVIKEFYKSKILPEQLDYHKKYFGTKKDSFKIEEKNDRIYISFTVICGAYGIKSEITDIDTNEILFKRKVNNADVKDFRIMFAFSKDQKGFKINKGVVLFEVIGQYGVKTITTNKLREFLSNNFHVIPFFYTVSTREAFERLIENGSFKKINLIKNEVSPEFSNILGINCGKEVRTVAVASIVEKKNFIDKLLNFATSNNEVYEIDDKYDDISITMDIGGRTKTTSIKDISSLYIIEKLPNDVLDIDGEMNVQKINTAMMQYADDYLNNIVEGDEIVD